MFTHCRFLFLIIVWTTNHSLDNVLSLADILPSSNHETTSENFTYIRALHPSYHADNIALISTALRLIGSHSELHHTWQDNSANSISKHSSDTNQISSLNDAICMLKIQNSTISLESWILNAEEPNTIVSHVSSSHVVIRDSAILSNIYQSPFVILWSNTEHASTIQIIASSHNSKLSDLLPLVDIDKHQDSPDIGHSSVETSEEQTTKRSSERLEGDEICVVGSSLNLTDIHLPIGSGPLFSFGIRNARSSSLTRADIRVHTTLTSSSLLNVTSPQQPLSENQNRFRSLTGQAIVGCCVSRCSNHDSGTTMLDVNAGGDLHCLNTSFSSCIRQSNTPESYPNKNYTQGQRFASASESLITSATFTSCTFREMTGSYGDNTGGSAIFVKSATSVTITQCSLHICNVSGINDDGGCIFYSPPLSGENALVIKTSSFTECKAIGAVFNYGGTLFTRDALLVSIDESFFEKGVAQYGSALFFYYQTTTKISNSSFVDCESLVHSTIRINNYVTISSLDYLLLRNCQANGKPAASDIYFETLLYSDVKSKISFCDSTSGSPNIYFGSTETSDDTLIPQISSTPTVETCEVTFSGNVATVTVTTKEVIGGAMGILLEGCLVPRLVFVVFVTGGQNSTTGSATVSSGANGILPSATYSPSKTRTSSKTRPFMDSQVLWG